VVIGLVLEVQEVQEVQEAGVDMASLVVGEVLEAVGVEDVVDVDVAVGVVVVVVVVETAVVGSNLLTGAAVSTHSITH